MKKFKLSTVRTGTTVVYDGKLPEPGIYEFALAGGKPAVIWGESDDPRLWSATDGFSITVGWKEISVNWMPPVGTTLHVCSSFSFTDAEPVQPEKLYKWTELTTGCFQSTNPNDHDQMFIKCGLGITQINSGARVCPNAVSWKGHKFRKLSDKYDIDTVYELYNKHCRKQEPVAPTVTPEPEKTYTQHQIRKQDFVGCIFTGANPREYNGLLVVSDDEQGDGFTLVLVTPGDRMDTLRPSAWYDLKLVKIADDSTSTHIQEALEKVAKRAV